MARLYPVTQFLLDSGAPLESGTINTYITGTSTNKTTYKDQAEGSTHANPIVLGTDGRVPDGAIWLAEDTEYRFIIEDKDGNQIDQLDNVSGIVSPLNGSYETHTLKFQTGRGLSDSNGNETIKLTETASAVNEFTIANAATGNSPSIAATGDDSNVGITVQAKGTGTVQLSTNGTIKANLNSLGGAIIYNCLFGLGTALDTDTDHDVKISPGTCADSTNTVLMTLTSELTKQIDFDWAVGDDAGGFPSGLTLTNSTWYHLFLTMHTDGTVDAGWDTSTTASNLLSDSSHTYYRRIMSHYINASTNITPYDQYGRYYYLG